MSMPRMKFGVAAVISIFCAFAFTACTEVNDYSVFYGNYVFEKQIYISPLSSFTATGDFKEYYTLTKDFLVVTNMNGKQQKIAINYDKRDLDEIQFENDFFPGNNIPDISSYKEKQQYSLADADGRERYRLYRLDDQIWLACIHSDKAGNGSEYIWSIYKIEGYDGEIPSKA